MWIYLSLSGLGSGYDKNELQNIYTSNDLRVNGIISSLYRYVTDIDEVIGLRFCMSVELLSIWQISLIADENKKPSFREGVKHFREIKVDAFFITLNKSESESIPYVIPTSLLSGSELTIQAGLPQKYKTTWEGCYIRIKKFRV